MDLECAGADKAKYTTEEVRFINKGALSCELKFDMGSWYHCSTSATHFCAPWKCTVWQELMKKCQPSCRQTALGHILWGSSGNPWHVETKHLLRSVHVTVYFYPGFLFSALCFPIFFHSCSQGLNFKKLPASFPFEGWVGRRKQRQPIT